MTRSASLLSGISLALLGVAPVACSDDPIPGVAPSCSGELLPLQNPRAHTLGETFYLPRTLAREGCSADLAWEVSSAPDGSLNRVHHRGAPEPRFTPDVPGDYTFRLPGTADAPLLLRVVARTPAERFRNHQLTPLYGAALVGDEIWTANGATYTVTRLAPGGPDGVFARRDEIPVGAWPAAVAFRDPLPYAVVAQRGSDTVGFVDRARGVLEDALWVGDEPTGLAITPDAKTLYVSLATMRQVAVVDLDRREVTARIDVGFDPRAVTISSDGQRLFVASYRSGNRIKDIHGSYQEGDDQDLWIVDTASLTVRETIEGVSADLRAIALAEDGSELYVAATDGDPIPSQADMAAAPFVHEVVAIGADPAAPSYGQVLRRADLTRQAGSGGPVVNPAGVLAAGDTLWVSSESSDLVVALDRGTLVEKARVAVGAGARQILPLGDDGSVAVHCYQSMEIWILGADGGVRGTVALAEDARPPEVALGERVFTRPGGNWAANHACSSCHVETQNDGMVWRFGPMIWHNVRPLQLLDATTPLEWGAYVSSTDNFGYQGPASIVSRPATPEESVGLRSFLGSLLGAPRATGSTRLDGSYSEAGLRGKALFEGKATCTACHAPPLYTSREYIPEGKSGVPADVPSLLGVYRHGVYFVNGQSRRLEDAVDVALDYVGVSLAEAERSDLLFFLRELTPKGGAPLGIWPDIDSDEGVYPDVAPWVAFADPVDDSVPGRTAAEVAAEYVVLQDASGGRVAASVTVSGSRIQLFPAEPLTPGERYLFRVLEGLPFQSGGSLWAERSTEFQVARPAGGAWAGPMVMTVEVQGPMGPPAMLPLLLVPDGTLPGALRVVIQPLVFGAQQRQVAWVRLDGDRFLMQPLALPISPSGSVADAREITGTIKTTDQGKITLIEGTLRIGGPGIDIPGVPFQITP